MRRIANVALALMLATAAYGAQDLVTAVHGTIVKIDSGTKTVVVKTADGTRRSLHLLDRTAVHGADLSAVASKDSWHGLSEGEEVVAHYTKPGGEDTAVEIDRAGQGGLKAAKGTVTEIDRGGRRLVVDTGSGAKETFKLATLVKTRERTSQKQLPKAQRSPFTIPKTLARKLPTALK